MIEKAVDKAVAKVTKVFEEKIEILQKDNVEKAREIDRLRNQINKIVQILVSLLVLILQLLKRKKEQVLMNTIIELLAKKQLEDN